MSRPKDDATGAEPGAGKRSRQEARRRLTRLQIVIAAFEELAEAGVDSVLIQKIMKRAGFAFNTFYIHFPDRQAAFEAVLTDIIHPWRAAYAPLLGPGRAAAVCGVIRIWTLEFRRTPELARFFQRNSAFLLGLDLLAEGDPGGPPSSALWRSQTVGLLSATATLILLGEAPPDIDAITARAILNLTGADPAEIQEALARPAPAAPSPGRLIKAALEDAMRDSLGRDDILGTAPEREE